MCSGAGWLPLTTCFKTANKAELRAHVLGTLHLDLSTELLTWEAVNDNEVAAQLVRFLMFEALEMTHMLQRCLGNIYGSSL